MKDMDIGDLQGLVVLNPGNMGYEAFMTLAAHLDGKKIEKRIDTGVVMISPENLNDEESQRLLNPPLEEYLNQ